MINVLIVDDDAMVADLNRCYIERVDGFVCIGIASTLQQAKDKVLDRGPAYRPDPVGCVYAAG
ncbi:Transcriptional regulatory protein dcuR [Kluyvera cryocrescens]|uniref:Transcriptional regulatory protein dcuR n=1 Tax=Kluyvera cryocrescens TaxID=580 RepID=A0A485BVZ2_KLUCR|nr:Transcriptional regulatory protein dcuR [Kluyvera cryocrescens]